MATQVIKLKHGLKTSLDTVTAAVGEPIVTLDSGELFIGTGNGLRRIGEIEAVVDTKAALPATGIDKKLYIVKKDESIDGRGATYTYVDGAYKMVGAGFQSEIDDTVIPADPKASSRTYSISKINDLLSAVGAKVDTLTEHMSDAEAAIAKLNSDASVDGSVASSIKKAVDPVDARVTVLEGKATQDETNIKALQDAVGIGGASTGTSLTDQIAALKKEVEDADAAESKARQDADAAESKARTDADAALDAKVAQEVKDRTDADTALQTALAQEVTDRKAGDKTLQDEVDKEVADRTAADSVLDGKIAQEVKDRTDADTALSTKLDTEVAARQAGDTTLQTALTQEIKDRTDADTSLDTKIAKEVKDRTDADSVLDGKIAQEISDRTAADTALQTALTQEVSDRKADTKAIRDSIAQPNGIASLDSNGKIPVGQIPVEFRELRVVKDIAARDALVDKFEGLRVHVIDATADKTVTAGWAEYLCYKDADGNYAYIKVAEGESIDVILEWTNIVGKPTSAVADIDDAVARKHSHANKDILDAINKAFTQDIYDQLVNAIAEAKNIAENSANAAKVLGIAIDDSAKAANKGLFLNATADKLEYKTVEEMLKVVDGGTFGSYVDGNVKIVTDAEGRFVSMTTVTQ